MSEAFIPLTAPEAVAAAHRVYDRLDRALSIRRGLTGIQDRDIVSIVILARQLDAIARSTAAILPLLDLAEAVFAGDLASQLQAAGYLPLPETTAQEATHGEG